MKKNAGMIAVLTVILAVFGVSNLPKKTTEAQPQASNSNEAKNTLKNKFAKTPQYDACEELRKRIQPFVKQLKEWRLADSCSGTAQPRPKTPLVGDKLRVIIATAPNPISTHLPLMFDRIVEVIQQAAQDENYSYDSSWFPWDSSTEYTTLDDQHRAEEEREALQTEPGIITFRRALSDHPNESPYDGGLLVFVVSEQPTNGIDPEEFENALDWIATLGTLTPGHQLRILGPTFSGSLPSVQKALESKRLAPFDHQRAIQISSGSVSSDKSYDWFREHLSDHELGSFNTFMEGDTEILQRFTDYIQCEGYRLKRVAFLSEDETAFGSQPSAQQPPSCKKERDKPDPDNHPIYLYYPRDIATLRSAYERQSILTPAKSATDTASSTSLRGDLSEPATSQHDTVRTYGGQLDPLAQESQLLNIVNILSEHHVQFVIIRSTNSLDQIFLTQFIRRVFPEARVVIDGSDLLFRRGAEGTSLRGVMTLSSYPLLVWQQDWSPSALLKGNGSYRVFGEDVSQGIYIAARSLLENSGSPPIVPISDYAAPSWASKGEDTRKDHPATWISVIGHHQFWPVAVLRRGDGILQTLPTLSDGDVTPLHIGSELKVLLLLGAVWSILHLLWCLRGSVVPTTSAFRLACFAPQPRRQHPFLIAMGSLLPAFAAVVTASATGLLAWSWNAGRGIPLALWVLGMIAASVWACGGNFRLPVASGTPDYRPKKNWPLIAGMTAVAALALFCLLYLYYSHNLTPENRIPLYWRSAHLLSGVSPLLPQLLLLVGLYLWFWFSLRGLALFGDDRPLLPKEVDLPVSDDVLRRPMTPMFSREGAEKPLEKVSIPFGKSHLRVILVLLPAAIIIFGLALEDTAVRTLGERAFGIEIFFWLTFCISLILADTAQVWMIWKKLHSLLNYLDRLPVRRTLAALRGMSWASVWKMSGNTMEERYRVISRQFESLRHLANCLPQWTPTNATREEHAEEQYRKEQLSERIERCQKSGRDFAEWYVTLRKQSQCDIAPLRGFQEELASTAGSVLKNLLLPAWRNESVSLIFDRKTDHADKDEGPRVKFDTENVAPHVLAAEEFFVLPYLAFIQNVLGRIRTIVLGSLCLFVATTFAVSSYPFDPLSTLGALFLGVFAVTGGTVILVFAQMNRDATLSYITNTNPGELGSHFWVQLITFGVGPLLGLLTTLFPSLTDFVTSWLQPGVEALK